MWMLLFDHSVDTHSLPFNLPMSLPPIPSSVLSSLPTSLLSYRSHGCRQRTVRCGGASRLGGQLAMGSGDLVEEEEGEEATGKRVG